jgi:ubiquinone/menaquinone biosynthesis C-methylase UbiE
MREAFVRELFGNVRPEGTVLAICAGPAEREVLPEATVSDISTGQDAHSLPYEDGSFDFAFVSDGLHHCSQPHRALAEMYRVSRKGVIVVESRDSAAVRLAARLGLSREYELEAVSMNGGVRGGVDDTAVPNHVYRWTEREFEKTLRSLDPTGPITFRFFYALTLPARLRVFSRFEKPVQRLLRKQCNTFAMVAFKPTTVWPWLDGDQSAMSTLR